MRNNVTGYQRIVTLIEGVDKNTQFDLEYSSGAILESLFRSDSPILEEINFKQRMYSTEQVQTKSNSNNIFRAMKNQINKEKYSLK